MRCKLCGGELTDHYQDEEHYDIGTGKERKGSVVAGKRYTQLLHILKKPNLDWITNTK
ncbi:MAG TPA: hypothetical protein VFD60_03310 [Nitrososphaeraceae archaeon]|nr:hypothetical protein [Nitrososphaeraceae archaeon]